MNPKESSENSIGFWSLSVEETISKMESSLSGLSQESAERKRRIAGANTIKVSKRQSPLLLFINQFKSPITIMLLLAAILSFFLEAPTDATIIIVIVLFSTILGFWQEKSAGNATAKLLAMVRISATVVRDGKVSEIPVEEVVPGDMVMLSAGDIIPADCLLVESDELFVDEAAFTGETFPVEKQPSILPAATPLAKRSNALFMGAHVVSGTAKAIAVATGLSTEFGHISQRLKGKVPETEFEHGIRRFGYLLMQVTFIMALLIFGANMLLHKPVLDSLLFTLAITVGLTPQLLPAIISVNLSQGAKRMARKQVIVKRLNSIENFGSMNVLCSDKTGTLTEGKVRVGKGLDCFGSESSDVLLLAKINAVLQQGFKNPIDEAIAQVDLEGYHTYTRVDEIPYDFIRKRLSLLVSNGQSNRMVTKGAVKQVLAVCSHALNADGTISPIADVAEGIQQTYRSLSEQGYRTLGVASKEWSNTTVITKADEREMVFVGFVSLFDPLKEGIKETIDELRALGIRLKIITGDNVLIAKNMISQLGVENAVILTGEAMRSMSNEALFNQVGKTHVFAEVEPNQKERIIFALKKAGNVVGYMGDGINDASAIHAADVGLSVNTAVDVAKEAADIVLLDQDLNVLIEGVREGRRTFANTQKYIFMATSANFGNMFSMAGASLLLPFLPLLPKQILLTNLITDFPSMTISTDNVDGEWTDKPRRWNIGFIKRFMLAFGLLSSVFDYLTFGVLLYVFRAGESEFQTGWFIESVVSATLIVMVVRTRKSFLKSRPGKYLLIVSLVVALLVLGFPSLPFAGLLGFSPLPFKFYLAMLSIVGLYILCAEMLKKWFYKRFG